MFTVALLTVVKHCNKPNIHEELNGYILRNEKERIANIQINMTDPQKHAEQKQARQKDYT